MNEQTTYDVAVIGCGPSGLAAAALLATRGHSVVAIEKHPSRYGLPRAGHIDHEIVRILQGVGAHKPILEDDPKLPAYEWKTADGEILLSFPFGEPSVSAFQSDYMIFQPVLDDALYDSLGRCDNATTLMACEVVGLRQGSEGVELELSHTAAAADGTTVATNERGSTFARYVIAADGAGSSVRDRLLGIGRLDKGFDEAWLDIDVRLKRPLPPEVNGQWCDPARPIYIGPLGRRHHRFECALLPGETIEAALRPEMVWEVLGKYGVGADDVEPFRQIVYRFEARIAERWRDGRVLLLGDAAHTMPPFLGQGLCSGIRDAANLAWKLDLVLRARSSDALLDSYELERRDHVEAWIDLSVVVGRISQVLDPVLAAERDDRIRRGEMPLALPPILHAGILDTDAGGTPVGAAGKLFVQAPVETATGSGLLHDVFGHGFLLVGRGQDPISVLTPAARSRLETLDTRLVWLGRANGNGNGNGSAFSDPTGRIARYLDEHEMQAALVRPDYYVAGGVHNVGDLSALVLRLTDKVALTGPA